MSPVRDLGVSDAARGPWKANAPRPATKAAKKPKAAPRPLEWQLQAAFVAECHKMQDEGFDFELAGDMNAGKRGKVAANIAKLTGMTAGEPDLRMYFSRGRLLLVEFKRPGGKLSEAQNTRHARLQALGFDVVTLWPADDDAARGQARTLVEGFTP